MKILFIDTVSEAPYTSAPFGEDTELTVEYATSVPAASEKIHVYEYDCIVLCCNVNNASIEDLLAAIVQQVHNSGLIVLLKEDLVEYKIKALHAGADDCLVIPYHPEELTARILAIVRRKKFHARDNIHFGNMSIDLSSKSVFIWNTAILLTRKEYDLLLYLIMNRTKTVSQIQIYDYLWGDETEHKEAPNLLVTHIKNLRKKLSQAKAEIEIKNIYGVGYRIIEL